MSIEFETSSGNVFEDINVANPDGSLAKAELAVRILHTAFGLDKE